MATPESTEPLANLITGFGNLGSEYVRLFQQYQTLERKLLTVREQVRHSLYTVFTFPLLQ